MHCAFIRLLCEHLEQSIIYIIIFYPYGRLLSIHPDPDAILLDSDYGQLLSALYLSFEV